MSKASELINRLKNVDEKNGTVIGQITGGDDHIKVMLHPLKMFGKNSEKGKHLKDPDQREFDDAVEDAGNKGFSVIHVYSDDSEKVMKYFDSYN